MGWERVYKSDKDYPLDILNPHEVNHHACELTMEFLARPDVDILIQANCEIKNTSGCDYPNCACDQPPKNKNNGCGSSACGCGARWELSSLPIRMSF